MSAALLFQGILRPLAGVLAALAHKLELKTAAPAALPAGGQPTTAPTDASVLLLPAASRAVPAPPVEAIGPDTQAAGAGRVLYATLTGKALQAGARADEDSDLHQRITRIAAAGSASSSASSAAAPVASASTPAGASTQHPPRRGLAERMGHTLPPVPAAEKATATPTSNLRAAVALQANTAGLLHVQTISAATSAAKALQASLAGGPLGSAAAAARQAAGSAVSAVPAFASPDTWLRAGLSVLQDARAIVAQPSKALAGPWDAPEPEDASDAGPPRAATGAAASAPFAAASSAASARTPPARAPVAPPAVSSTSAMVTSTAAAAATPPSMASSSVSGLLAHVHELLHELLQLEHHMQQQEQRMRELQARLRQATQGGAAAEGASAAGAGQQGAHQADAAGDAGGAGVSRVLLVDLRNELHEAELLLGRLEAAAAHLMSQLVVTAPATTGAVAAALAAGGAEAQAGAPAGASAGMTGGGSSSSSTARGSSGSGSATSNRLHGDKAALGSASGGSGRAASAAKSASSTGRVAGMAGSSRGARRVVSKEEQREQQKLARQLVASGNLGLLSPRERDIVTRVARGEAALAGGGGLGGGGPGGGGRPRWRRSGGGDEAADDGGRRGPRFKWLWQMSRRQLVQLAWQSWLAAVLTCAAAWYAYQLLWKVPMEEMKSMAATATHVVHAGSAVAQKTAEVASHAAQAVGSTVGAAVAHPAPPHTSPLGKLAGAVARGVKAVAKSARNTVGDAGAGAGGVLARPLRTASSAGKAVSRGSRLLLHVLAPSVVPAASPKQQDAAAGSGSAAATTTSSGGGGGGDVSEATTAAARLGVGAALLLLASRAGGGSGASGGAVSGKKRGGRRSEPRDERVDVVPYGEATYGRGSAPHHAGGVGGMLAERASTLARATSGWVADSIKHTAGAVAGAGSDTRNKGGRRTEQGRGKGRQPAAAAAAAPAGVLGYDDGVFHHNSAPAASPTAAAAANASAHAPSRARAVPGAAVWGRDASALLHGVGPASAPQQQPGVVAAAGDDQARLQQLYRSLSTRPGSWR
jgi:hypothetical protein